MTNIEWTRNPDGSKGKSWNPIRARNKESGKRGWFCAPVHEGCRFCYAERINIKAGDTGGNGVAYKAQNEALVDIYLDEETLLEPLHWKKPQRVFVCSMSDLFGSWVKEEWLDKIFAVMARCPQHTFIMLTKRPDRMHSYMGDLGCDLPDRSAGDGPREGTWTRIFLLAASQDRKQVLREKPHWPLPNVWGLVSCSTQEDADKFIPILLDTPLAKRGVSLEPLLGPIDLARLCILPQKPGSIRAGIHIDALRGRYCESGVAYTGDWDVSGPAPPDSERRTLSWVIGGGESGTKEQDVRPMHPDWLRSLRDQCRAAGVPFFFKQWGEYLPVGQSLPGCGKVNGATAVKPGRMKLHYGGTPTQAPNYAFAECGVEFALTIDGRLTFRVGKKRAGRKLDGVEHNEFPQQASS